MLCGDTEKVILEYTLTDNKLEKENPIDFPVHLQDNIVLRFYDKNGLINDKSYAFIKTHDNVKKVKIIKNGELCACEMPPFVTHNTFFKLKVLILQGRKKMITNELIIPIRTNDYLDYNRTIAHIFPKHKGAIDDEFMYEKDGWDVASDGMSELEIRELIKDKADVEHKHIHDDITDWDEEVEEDLDLFLLNITDKIREI